MHGGRLPDQLGRGEMSVLVKDMEMPCACVDCALYEADLYWCLGAKKEVPYSPVDKRAEFCPLVEVPTPHGRLIDADALRYEIAKYFNGLPIQGHYDMLKMVDEAPTIIETEADR